MVPLWSRLHSVCSDGSGAFSTFCTYWGRRWSTRTSTSTETSTRETSGRRAAAHQSRHRRSSEASAPLDQAPPLRRWGAAAADKEEHTLCHQVNLTVLNMARRVTQTYCFS